jgi:hypothetical protein
MRTSPPCSCSLPRALLVAATGEVSLTPADKEEEEEEEELSAAKEDSVRRLYSWDSRLGEVTAT